MNIFISNCKPCGLQNPEIIEFELHKKDNRYLHWYVRTLVCCCI